MVEDKKENRVFINIVSSTAYPGKVSVRDVGNCGVGLRDRLGEAGFKPGDEAIIISYEEFNRLMRCTTEDPKGYRIQLDGNAWCANGEGFINIQESDSGWGDTPMEALLELLSTEESKKCCVLFDGNLSKEEARESPPEQEEKESPVVCEVCGEAKIWGYVGGSHVCESCKRTREASKKKPENTGAACEDCGGTDFEQQTDVLDRCEDCGAFRDSGRGRPC